MNESLRETSSPTLPAFETMQYRVNTNRVAVITIDVPGNSVNVLTPELHREVAEVSALLAADENAIGAVLHSGKPGFLAGGDLKRIVRYYDMQRSPADANEQSRTFTRALRQLETCGKPVVAAINGSALGGGLELAMACHHRVVIDDDSVILGLPEVTLGLVPGAGGTQRLPRLIGLQKATSLVLEGTILSPTDALKIGLIDELAAADVLLDVAEKWVLEHGDATQPWDRRGFRVPGGSKLNDMNIGRLFQITTAKVGSKYRHNYPAPIAALRCLFNGTTVNSIDQGLRIESREFSALTRNPVARNIIRTLFINKRARKFRKEDADRDLIEDCQRAYADEVQRMLQQGLTAALIANAAWAAGMDLAPAGLSQSDAVPVEARQLSPEEIEDLKSRLLAVQCLTAAERWASDDLDVVAADLSSVLAGDFPSYTGGVMSYVDTMGLKNFIALCDRFAAEFGDHFQVSRVLRARAMSDMQIYERES